MRRSLLGEDLGDYTCMYVCMYICIPYDVAGVMVCFDGCRFAFVEFSNPESVPIALQYNGAMFGDRPIK